MGWTWKVTDLVDTVALESATVLSIPSKTTSPIISGSDLQF